MPITLAEAKLNVQDDLQMGVIDEFRKSSFLFENLTFDDAVSPTGGGGTLTYGYTRLLTQPTADFRDINAEYTPQSVTRKRHTVDLKVFGGSFEIDRVIAKMGGIVDEVTLQIEQKVKAATALFNDTVINGDTGTNAKAFDGLDKALLGSSTEYTPTAAIDLSDSGAIDANYKTFLDQLDEFLLGLDGAPSAIMGNSKLIAKIRAVARRSAMYSTQLNVDLGTKAGSNDPVVGINGQGETSLYVARLGLDGFHGVSLAGDNVVNLWLPDFTSSGAVKKGEVEMVAAVALKASKAAGVFRKIKVK